MSDGYVALKAAEVLFGESMRHQTHGGVKIYLFAIGSSDAGAFLSSMLQGIEGKESKPADIYFVSINTENAAAFMHSWRSLMIIRLFAGKGQFECIALSQSRAAVMAFSSTRNLCPAPGSMISFLGSFALP